MVTGTVFLSVLRTVQATRYVVKFRGAGQGPLWLVAPRSTIIQVSPVHAGVCESPEATLAELFRRLVIEF